MISDREIERRLAMIAMFIFYTGWEGFFDLVREFENSKNEVQK